MYRLNGPYDGATIMLAQNALANAKSEVAAAKLALSTQEQRKQTLLWAHQQAGYEHHQRTSASGLYMTAYGSSRSHMDRCNANMDFKERIDRKHEENLADCQSQIRQYEKDLEKAERKVSEAEEALRRLERN